MVRDLWGHVATDAVDPRPWLDHGRWAQTAPMALRPGPAERAAPPEFLIAEELDQLPLGPVHGGITTSAHLRLGLLGETVRRLETRLGYTHKGTLTLMRGKSPRAAARYAARLAAEVTVAHAIAFARATEAASDCDIPPRAAALRDAMAALERITGHLDTLTQLAETAGLALPASLAAQHAEALRRAANLAFGHRLMMDCITPGGLAADINPGGGEAVLRAARLLQAELPDLRGLLAIGRLSGIGVIRDQGDVAMRADLRCRDIAASLTTLIELLAALPEGGFSAPLPVASGEAVGWAGSARGDIWHWLRLDHGQIASAFLCDPAWAQWLLLEEVVMGASVDDLPVVLASFGLSCSGMDL
jgi:Ni,Fe-hydrogenase III large subunit